MIAASAALFGRGALAELDARTLAAALAEAPHVDGRLTRATVVDCWPRPGCRASRSAARRTVREGGAYVNNRKPPTRTSRCPTPALHGRFLVLRRGKRNVAVVERAEPRPAVRIRRARGGRVAATDDPAGRCATAVVCHRPGGAGSQPGHVGDRPRI